MSQLRSKENPTEVGPGEPVVPTEQKQSDEKASLATFSYDVVVPQTESTIHKDIRDTQEKTCLSGPSHKLARPTLTRTSRFWRSAQESPARSQSQNILVFPLPLPPPCGLLKVSKPADQIVTSMAQGRSLVDINFSNTEDVLKRHNLPTTSPGTDVETMLIFPAESEPEPEQESPENNEGHQKEGDETDTTEVLEQDEEANDTVACVDCSSWQVFASPGWGGIDPPLRCLRCFLETHEADVATTSQLRLWCDGDVRQLQQFRKEYQKEQSPVVWHEKTFWWMPTIRRIAAERQFQDDLVQPEQKQEQQWTTRMKRQRRSHHHDEEEEEPTTKRMKRSQPLRGGQRDDRRGSWFSPLVQAVGNHISAWASTMATGLFGFSHTQKYQALTYVVPPDDGNV
jgi:hypothetical protein